MKYLNDECCFLYSHDLDRCFEWPLFEWPFTVDEPGKQALPARGLAVRRALAGVS